MRRCPSNPSQPPPWASDPAARSRRTQRLPSPILEPRTDAPSGPSTDSLPEAPPQAADAQSAPPEQTSAREGQSQHSPAGPRSHRAPQARRRVFEDPTPSRISRRRRAQAALIGSSMQAAAAPDAVTVTGTVTTSPLSASVAPTSGASTASANTVETEPVLASTPPGTQTGRHATEAPASPIAAAACRRRRTGKAPAAPAGPAAPRAHRRPGGPAARAPGRVTGEGRGCIRADRRGAHRTPSPPRLPPRARPRPPARRGRRLRVPPAPGQGPRPPRQAPGAPASPSPTRRARPS